MKKISRALISLSDKSQLDILVQELIAHQVEILSTGGTASAIQELGFLVTAVEEVTGFPEILDGRVKTLHPMIHGGILADRHNPDHLQEIDGQGIVPIDLVVVNLYPFQEKIREKGITLQQAIESIDIGGPTLIRAAAKNWEHVVVLTDPGDYSVLVEALKKEGGVRRQLRIHWAQKAFAHTAAYDSLISRYFWDAGLGKKGEFPPVLNLSCSQVKRLRYGENPHQRASLYAISGAAGPSLLQAQQLHGKDLSYNNLNDAAAALDLVRECVDPAAVVVKHTNPCGAALGRDLQEAFVKAYQGDPLSAFGGIVAFNRRVEEGTAREIAAADKFFEVILAPDYSAQALSLIRKRWENIRLLAVKGMDQAEEEGLHLHSLPGGALLVQTPDTGADTVDTWQVVSERGLQDTEKEDLYLAWITAKHVKSNAITLVKNRALQGVGAGQMSRVDAMEIALMKSSSTGGVVGSDAFFPKVDAIEAAGKANVTAIIQPGGSVADEEVLAAVNRYGMAMVFTGRRHFRH